jgi:flagellar basal-body rod modification protein FlgD
MKKSLGMNKDDFMKLFIAQLKYQDPLKPQDATAMLDQLSQLTMVEQSYNNTTATNNLLAAQNNSISLTALTLIGKDVKANGNEVSFDGSTAPTVEFSLASAATSSQLSIANSAGVVVRTVDLGSVNSGDSSYVWDGRDGSGALLAAGSYTFAVNAKAGNGGTVTATTYTTGKIDGVDLSGSVPQLNIGASSIALSDVISVKGV